MLFFCVLFSFLLINATIRKLNLHKQHVLAGFVFVTFTFFVPEIFHQIDLAFVLLLFSLSLFRLFTTKQTKAAIFEFSLLIIVAAFFNFWMLLFLLLGYLFILFFNKFDYKNLLIPLVVATTIIIITEMIDILYGFDFLATFLYKKTLDFNIAYFSTTAQRIVFSLFISFIMFFNLLYVFQSEHMSSVIKSYYMQLVITFIIGVLVFLVNEQKQNEYLILLAVPVSIFAGRYFENMKDKRLKEFVAWVFVIFAIVSYIISL